MNYTLEELTTDELAALARYRKERDSDNEYTPWLSEGLTEAQYFQRLYLANSNLLAVAELVISRLRVPIRPNDTHTKRSMGGMDAVTRVTGLFSIKKAPVTGAFCLHARLVNLMQGRVRFGVQLVHHRVCS